MTCNDKENRLHTEVRIAEKYFKIVFFFFLYSLCPQKFEFHVTKIVFITVFHMCKSQQEHTELLNVKTRMSEMKNTWDGINGRLNITEEKISKLEDIPV